MCGIEVNIEYFVFPNCCNLFFYTNRDHYQIPQNICKRRPELLVRWLYVEDFLTVNVKYCGFFLA